MILKFRKEILHSFFLLLVIRLLLYIAGTYNPYLYEGLGGRLDLALVVMGLVVGLMYLPHERIGKWVKETTGKAPKLNAKQLFGLIINVSLGTGILLYVIALVLEEIDITIISSLEVMMVCIFLAIVAAMHPYRISRGVFTAYSLLLGLVFGFYTYLIFEDYGVIRYTLSLIIIVVLPAMAWVMKDGKK